MYIFRGSRLTSLELVSFLFLTLNHDFAFRAMYPVFLKIANF